MGIDRVLRGHDLFGLLSVDQMKRLSEFSSVKQYTPGEVIFRHNDKAGHVFMLLEGSVQLRLPAEHHEYSLVVSQIEKGELFGLSPLLESARYTATAQCSGPTEVLAIEAAPFLELLKSNCTVGYGFINRVAHIYFTRYLDVLQSLQGVVNQVSLIR